MLTPQIKAAHLSAVVLLLLAAVLIGRAQTQPSSPVLGVASQMKALDALNGEWSITGEFIGLGPKQSRTPTTGTSSIRPVLSGAMLEEHLDYTFDGGQVQNIVYRSYDQYRKVYRVGYFDNVFGLFDVYEGNFTRGELVITNLRCGTSFPVSGPGGRLAFGRLRYRQEGNDKLHVELQATLDKGKTWRPAGRFLYVRKK